MTDRIMLRDLGSALRFMALVAMVRKMQLTSYEKFVIGNALRDLADEIEIEQPNNRVVVP
jgi:hypothetical protein